MSCTGSRNRTAGVPPASTGSAAPDRRGWRSRGYLPHFDAPKLVQHIVFRLADSLPGAIREEIANTLDDDRVAAVDAALDRGHGSRHLTNPQIAQLVETALLAFDRDRYALNAWCIMPNHVHVLIETMPEYTLDRIVHSWKSYTAKKAKQMLGRAGAFWAPEYFDRYMRDVDHFAAVVAYIEGNPVKAGLCENVEHWRFSSAWQRAGGTPAVR